MAWITKTRLKYALAGAGALYIILFVGYLVYAGTRTATPQGPSELEAHPERQAEIVSRRRAEELRDQLQITEDQTQKIAAIYLKYESNQSPDGEPRGRWREQQKEIDLVLTPDQREQLEQIRAQFRGPGGPGGPEGFGGPGGMRGQGTPGAPGGAPVQITPERIESLKQSMTPEQRERFEKAAQQMQRRGSGGPGGQGGQRGGQRGGGRGPRQGQPEQQQ